MQKRGIQIKPETATLLWGLVTLILATLTIVLPPLQAPVGDTILNLFIGYSTFCCLIAVIVTAVAALVKKRWMVIPCLSGIVLALYWLSFLSVPIENLWMTKFKESKVLREQFVAFMDQKSETDSPIKLPPHLLLLSERKMAYLTVDVDGNRYYCYSVFTQGIDNSRGYCWSPSGKPPPEEAFPRITRSWRVEGTHWYAFRST